MEHSELMHDVFYANWLASFCDYEVCWSIRLARYINNNKYIRNTEYRRLGKC